MRTRALTIAALILGLMGFASLGIAQGPPEKFEQGTMPKQSKSFSLADELDEIGQSLFGDILPGRDKPQKTQAAQPAKRTAATPPAVLRARPRRTAKPTPNTSLSGRPSPRTGRVGTGGRRLDPAPARTGPAATRPVRRPTVETATLGNRPTGSPTGVRTDACGRAQTPTTMRTPPREPPSAGRLPRPPRAPRPCGRCTSGCRDSSSRLSRRAHRSRNRRR